MHILAKTLLIALTAACASAEEVYQWVDENGVTNYTQQRPKAGVDRAQAPRLAPEGTSRAGTEHRHPL